MPRARALSGARRLAAHLSLAVFPLRPGTKIPATTHGFKDASTDLEQIEAWWKAQPQANLGAPIPEGMVVIDIDSPEAMGALHAQELVLPTTVAAKTPRGWHFWYRCPIEARPKVGVFPSVDLRAPGSYVVLPPSRLRGGSEYRWEVEPEPHAFAEAPDWLVDVVRGRGIDGGTSDEGGGVVVREEASTVDAQSVLAGIPSGSRDVTLFKYACSLRARGMGRAEAEVLVGHAASACSPVFPHSQAMRKVEQAWRYDGPEKAANGPTVAVEGASPATDSRIWNVRELLATELPQPHWLVPPFLGEGLTVLVSPPKAGKSFLMGSICHAVSVGGICLGAFGAQPAGVLYLDLEQTEGQAQRRWQAVLDDEPPSERLFTAFEWPRMRSGGIERIDAFLDEEPGVRLVVIDILSRFWPERAKNDGHNAYHWESAVMGEMKDLAERRKIALVLVHHTNRSTLTDPLDKVSGTNAMTGVPGAILVLGRERASTDGKLYVTGRSVEEQTIEMTFNPHLRGWCAKDPLVAGGLGMPL